MIVIFYFNDGERRKSILLFFRCCVYFVRGEMFFVFSFCFYFIHFIYVGFYQIMVVLSPG